MSLLQIGAFELHGQGHRGVFYERIRQRVNLLSSLACNAVGETCVDFWEEQYRFYIRGNGALSRAQELQAELWTELCGIGVGGRPYLRRRVTEDANLEIRKIRSGKLEETDFVLQFTQCRTIALDVTFELEPIPAAEETDVIAGDLTVEP